MIWVGININVWARRGALLLRAYTVRHVSQQRRLCQPVIHSPVPNRRRLRHPRPRKTGNPHPWHSAFRRGGPPDHRDTVCSRSLHRIPRRWRSSSRRSRASRSGICCVHGGKPRQSRNAASQPLTNNAYCRSPRLNMQSVEHVGI